MSEGFLIILHITIVLRLMASIKFEMNVITRVGVKYIPDIKMANGKASLDCF